MSTPPSHSPAYRKRGCEAFLTAVIGAFTTANLSPSCVLLAQQERSSRPRIQLLRSPFVAFAWLGTHYLDLHVGQERSHRSQSREYRGDERHDTPHRNARRQRYLQEHLVVLVADDQAPHVPLRDQLLGTVH